MPLLQYQDNVINNGTADYASAYFELGAIRAFAVDASNDTSTALPPGATANSPNTPSGSSASSASGPDATQDTNTNAGRLMTSSYSASVSAVLAVYTWFWFS